MRLILAEDDALFGEAVQKSLTREGFAVDWVQSGADFFAATSCHSYDFAILDLCLPDTNGEQLMQRVRSKQAQLPVIVISSCRQSCRRVNLLDLGADDFLVKPLDLNELSARIRCVLRRLPEDKFDEASSQCGALRLFAQRCCASLYERSVNLTHREFWLLEVLVRKKNKIVSRSEIEDALYGWGEEVESNAVEVYVHHLRRKLGPDLIHTIRGVGYQLAPMLEHARPLAG